MRSGLLGLYHRLPGSARTLAASMHGYYLRSWRYGSETDRLVTDALERDVWPRGRWKDWRDERLAYILHRAATCVPYYEDYWLQRRRHGDRRSFEDIGNWPILDKDAVRQHGAAFVARGVPSRRLYRDHTSGTTGTPLHLWMGRDVVRAWYALYEARTRVWHGVGRHDRWGILGGQQVVPQTQRSAPYWVWNSGLRQLYLSSLHVAPWSATDYLEAIRRYRLRYLLGYSGSLHVLAAQACAEGQRVPLDVVITNAEPLFDYQRRSIGEAFACPVRETYGMAEMVCAASECPHGRLHLWPEVGFAEIVGDDEQPVPAGMPGRLIATGLLNSDMPLIRYDTRDRIQMAPESVTCTCGRSLPIIEQVWGRFDDVITTKDGRRIVQIDGIFDPSLPIREGQIVQEALERFTLRIVPEDTWSAAHERALRAALVARVGPVDVSVELVPHIERTWAGKFRIIESRVPSTTPPPGSRWDNL